MGGLDVVALRSVCAHHAETHVLPALRELQEAQDRLSARLQHLQAALELKASAAEVAKLLEQLEVPGALVEPAAGPPQPEQPAAPEGPRPEELLARIEELAARVETKVSAEGVLAVVRGEGLLEKIERKADADRVPSVAQLQDLAALVRQKANVREVPTLAQVQKLADTLGRKAFANKVPTILQLEELSERVNCNLRLVPTLAQFDELVADVKRKASAVDVPSMAQFRKLSSELDRKAGVEQLPGEDLLNDLARVQDVMAQLDAKADKSAVPTLADLKEHRTVVERKLAFLAAKLQERTDAAVDWYQPLAFCVQPVPMGSCADEDLWRSHQSWMAPAQQQSRDDAHLCAQAQAQAQASLAWHPGYKQQRPAMCGALGARRHCDLACEGSLSSSGSDSAANPPWDAGEAGAVDNASDAATSA